VQVRVEVCVSKTHLWNTSCSAWRSILSASSLSTFSLSLSSSCCVVSMQYSDVHRMLQVWHCSSSVNLITSPSFSRLWIRLLADAIVGCCLENFSSWPDKLSCLLILQQRQVVVINRSHREQQETTFRNKTLQGSSTGWMSYTIIITAWQCLREKAQHII